MLAVKSVVFQRHQLMLRLYEKFCRQASMISYWGEDKEDDNDQDIAVADETNEADCDDGF